MKKFLHAGTILFLFIIIVLPSRIFSQQLLTSFVEENALIRTSVTIANAGDINGDNYDDVMIEGTDAVQIFFGGSNMDSTADITISDASDSRFGNSFSSAGDVNNDGYDDIIINGRNYSYLFFGNNVIETSLTPENADVTIPTVSNSLYISSASSAGDVNNDGFDDVIIGYSSSLYTGYAVIYLGGAAMDSTSDITLTGLTKTDQFGCAATGVDDVNGDGYDDVLVGAYYYNSYQGAAYLYFGGESMDNQADITYTGENTDDYFGSSVSKLEDINGDGYNDICIGAYGYNDKTGAAYIYYGGSNIDNQADLTLTGTQQNDRFGYSISGGNFNGDSYNDIIVGAYLAEQVYIYYGGENIDSTVDVNIKCGELGYWFGESINGTGDFNDDGYDDVIVGYTSIFYGKNISSGASISSLESDVTIGQKTTDDNNFGYTVDLAGDVNGDGYDDIIVGASGYSIGGAAYIYFGNTTIDTTADVFMTGRKTSSFGWSVAGAGDVNNDGYDDVIVGCCTDSLAYIFYGGANMDSTADVIFTKSTGYYAAVSGAGDVNNDGYDDVIIGDAKKQRAFIYLGASEMDSIPDIELDSPDGSSNFSMSVSDAGDINADGFDDVLIGDGSYYSSSGRVYVYFGNANMDSDVDIIIEAEGTNSILGYSVAGAGDVNNDGYDDIILGAYGCNSYFGRAYIVLGNDSLSGNLSAADADIILDDNQTTYLGCFVNSAGDVNNDGYDDVICGACGYNSYTGRAYVYFGGADMDSTIDYTLTGENEGDYFGISVAPAGDFNGDRHSEFLVGAFSYSSSGKVYLYRYDNATGILSEDNTLATQFELMQNYPNPFNPTTTINFSLPQSDNVTLKIYNMLGQEVTTLIDKNMSAGNHSVQFDASNLSSGVYIYRVSAGEYVAAKKLMLLK